MDKKKILISDDPNAAIKARRKEREARFEWEDEDCGSAGMEVIPRRRKK